MAAKQNLTNLQYMSILKDGLSKDQWGYGIKRITIGIDPNIDMGAHYKIPYTFTSFGYKNENGKWFVGLRMNVDQCSPVKMRPMDAKTRFTVVWAEMMQELVKDYVNTHKQ